MVSMCIQAQDFAHVRPGTLGEALNESLRLFRSAGIELQWRREGKDGSCAVLLRILPQAPKTLPPAALGFAVPLAASGPQATVFYDRVVRAAEIAHAPLSVALGDAIAHEIGHDLIGTSEHSPAGLMQAWWSRATWELAKQGVLGFSAADRRKMIRRLGSDRPAPSADFPLRAAVDRHSRP